MKKFTLILALLIIIGCSNDDKNNSANKTDINLVTGINIRNSISSEIINLGNPNVFTNNQFVAYPNPPAGTLHLTSLQDITHIWIRPATADRIYQQADFNSILSSDLYSESQIESNAELEFLELNSRNIKLNLEKLTAGYYKVFVKINGTLYWENIFVPESNFQIDDLINYWK